MKHTVVGTLSIILLLAGILHASPAKAQNTSVLSPAELQAKYVAAGTGGAKVHILIVPGHEPGAGGAEYLDLKERDIVVPLADSLASYLAQDPHFEVTVARTQTAWNPALDTYFMREWTAIQDFITAKRSEMSSLIANGTVRERTFAVDHNTASTDTATRLYGINKWADEQGVDIAIHIHLNDNVDHSDTAPGNHSGFAVYVPDAQYKNAPTSAGIGRSIARELNSMSATSSLPIENYGTLEDQSLIALGSNNSAQHAAVLIEYAYIYESKITQPSILAQVTQDYAYQTYRGLESYFGSSLTRRYTTRALPRTWSSSPVPHTTSVSIYALQVALHRMGMYPAGDELLYDCPISGFMGSCTIDGIKLFQRSRGLSRTGTLGPQTRRALNKLFGT